MSENLIAYIPTLNKRHLDWLAKHSGADLFLISQEMAAELIPRLARNLAALPTSMMKRILVREVDVRIVDIFDPVFDDPDLSHRSFKSWILLDEDISHAVAEEYLVPAGCTFAFENGWARWDMKAVTQNQPVLADVEISTGEYDRMFMQKTQGLTGQSPDWWRQVAAVFLNADGKQLTAVFNTHMPTEYETYIFGDPAINRDAGQPGKSCAFHAEQAGIAECAKRGLALDGGSVYVTTFPCDPCAYALAGAGIATVYFRDGYSTAFGQETLKSRGVRIVQVKDNLDT